MLLMTRAVTRCPSAWNMQICSGEGGRGGGGVQAQAQFAPEFVIF